ASISHAVMSSSENNPQQPLPPNGFIQMPHEMMQQQFYLQMLAGMQFNGSGDPQMQPNFSMFLNPHLAMGGMPQQLCNYSQFGAATAQFAGPMPMMAGQIPQMASPMTAQSPLMPPPGQFIHYMTMPVFMPYLPGTALPAPIPIKEEMSNDAESVVECTPPGVSQPPFSIANILDQRKAKEEPVDHEEKREEVVKAVKDEPIDEDDLSLYNKKSGMSLNRPPKASDSSIRQKKFLPPSSLPTASMTREEIPDTPTSPDYRRGKQEGERDQQIRAVSTEPVAMVPSSQSDDPSSHEKQQEELVECDEYLSCDETIDNSAAAPLFTRSGWTSIGSNENTFSIGDTTMDEAHEKMTMDEETREKHAMDGVKREIMDGEEGEETTPGVDQSNLFVYGTAREPPRLPPSIPKRFPVPSMEPMEDRREERRGREERRSLRRMEKSPVRRRRAGRDESPERKKRRGNGSSVIVRGIPPQYNEQRIQRVFNDRYGRCRLSRVNGEPSAVRVEFVSKRDRDCAYSDRRVRVNSEKWTIHEDLDEERRDESKEVAGPSRDGRRMSPLRDPPPPEVKEEKEDIPSQLEKYEQLVGANGKPMKEHLLTAGPLPRKCDVTKVVHYFRSVGAAVFDSPYPTHRPHEYLVLRFADSRDAKRTLAASNGCRVDGHAIPVSPPYDVYLQMATGVGLEKTAMMSIQDACGVVLNHSSVFSKYTRRGISHYGYVTFGRPQDARLSIERGYFSVEGNREFWASEPDSNYSFIPFKDLWELKCTLDEMARKEKETKRETIKVDTTNVRDDNRSIEMNPTDLISLLSHPPPPPPPPLRADQSIHRAESRKGKRGLDGNSSGSIDSEEMGGVIDCSPFQKKHKPEEVRVRVCDREQWLPSNPTLLRYFQQFGSIVKMEYNDHLDAVVRFSSHDQATDALKTPQVKIAGVWISILPY
ncbi:hypothetical protein PENTCL1PPCAC_25086, partial [Pristionchus entomophagus]